MDSIQGPDELYRELFTIAQETPGVQSPHNARIRKLNDLYDINLDLEVDGNLTVVEGHEIAKALEHNIKKKISGIYDILVHVEPIGNKEVEQFGLSPEDFEEKAC